MAALRAGDATRVGRALSNDLQAPAMSLFPALRKTLAAGREFGALGALVSGSGPTCLFLAANASGRPTSPSRCPAPACAGRWPGSADRCPGADRGDPPDR